MSSSPSIYSNQRSSANYQSPIQIQKSGDEKVASTACVCFWFLKEGLTGLCAAIAACLLKVSSWITYLAFRILGVFSPKMAKRFETAYIYIENILLKMRAHTVEDQIKKLEEMAENSDQQLQTFSHQVGLLENRLRQATETNMRLTRENQRLTNQENQQQAL